MVIERRAPRDSLRGEAGLGEGGKREGDNPSVVVRRGELCQIRDSG